MTNIWASLGSWPRPRPRPLHSSLPLPPHFEEENLEETSRVWASSSPFIPFLMAVLPSPAASPAPPTCCPIRSPGPATGFSVSVLPMCDSRAHKQGPVGMSVDVGVQ